MNIPIKNQENIPVIPLPNPGEGGPIPTPEENTPVIPLPTPEQGEPIPDMGESMPENTPVIPLPTPESGRPIVSVWPKRASLRFLNAASGYQPFRIFVGNRLADSFLSYGALSAYRRFPSGYQTITVTGTDGYIYMQKSLPFEAGTISTVAVINRAGGLDLLSITDTCCSPSNGNSNFRVSNLAYNSGPIDVLLGDGRTIYADVRFKETTPYKQIQPGPYQFFFAETNFMPIPSNMDIESLDSAFIGMYPYPDTLASLYLNVRSGLNYTVFLLSDGAGGIQTMVSED